MTGTRTCLTISGTARAASSLFTVTRTSSLPAAWSALTWATVPAISAVSVLVMDWTTIGRSLPTLMPPTSTVTVFLRLAKLMVGEIYHGGRRRPPLVRIRPMRHNPPSDIRSMPNHLRVAQKAPDARRRPRAGREAYSLYVERAAEGANEADGAFSATRLQLVAQGHQGEIEQVADAVALPLVVG